MGNNQSTEQIRGTALQVSPPPSVSLRRIDLSAQDRPSPSPFTSPVLPPATLSDLSPDLSPALSPALSPTSSPASSPRFGSADRGEEENATITPATHVPRRPLSIIRESGTSESIYLEATPRLKPSATSTTNSPASARLGIADFSSLLVSVSDMDVEAAIMLLQEIKKHASPEDLIAFHQALEPEKLSGDLDTSKSRSCSNCSGVQGCVYESNEAPGFQPTSMRLSNSPRLGSLICDEKSWAGREFLRTLTFLQDHPIPPHPECLRIVHPKRESSAPDAIESWRHADGQGERGDSIQPSGEKARMPYVTTSTSKQSPTTPQYSQRSEFLSPPPTADSGYSSDSSGKSSSWNQYKVASGVGLAPRCESPLNMDSTDQNCLQRYLALSSSFDSLTSSNYDGNRGGATSVKLQSITPNQSSIIQKRPQKKRLPPTKKVTKECEPDTPPTDFSRRFSNPSGCSTPEFPTEGYQTLRPVTQAAANANKSRPQVRQVAELEADRPVLPLRSRKRRLSLFCDRSTENRAEMTQLAELEVDRPTLAICGRTKSRSLLYMRSSIDKADNTHSDALQLVELEADRPPSPPVRTHKRRSSLFPRRSTPYRVEITQPDARHFAELEAHRQPTPPMQSPKRGPSPRPNESTEEQLIAHVSITDLGNTASSLGSVLYDISITGIIPSNNVSSKQDVQQHIHCQQRCKSLGDLKRVAREASRSQMRNAPSVPMIDTCKYSFEQIAVDTGKPERNVQKQKDTSSSIASLASNRTSAPQWSSLSQPPVGTPLPMSPSCPSRKHSQISHLVARFEHAQTPTGIKGSHELHRNASMPSIRHKT